MANEEKKVWGIHTMDDNLFLNKNVIAIGWKEFGDCSKLEPTREAYKTHFIETYPNGKKGAIATSAGMLYRFACEMQIGDYVVFPSKIDRKINIGIVESNFIYIPDADPYVQQRKVKWLKKLPRTAFSQGALYEAGSAMTFFLIKNYAGEYLAALDKGFKKTILEEDETVILGAFGCGAFMNNPQVVAMAAKNVIKEYLHAFKNIEFAVYCSPRDDQNYRIFERVLKGYCE